MGYTIGLPTIKLSRVQGKRGKHCGNFKSVVDEALEERKGLDLDIDHSKTDQNYYEGIRSSEELQEYSANWIAEKDAETARNNEEIKQMVSDLNAQRKEQGLKVLKEKGAIDEINKNRKAEGLDPIKKGRKIQSDAVVMCGVIVKPPQAFMATLSEQEQERFLLDSIDILKDIVGEENFKSAVIHKDELVMHAHLFWQPVTKDGRLCAKELHNLKYMTRLNKEMPQKLRDKGWTMIDDCQAYDAEEEMKLREELGDAAYREHKKQQREKRGRGSKRFKDDMDKEVAGKQQEVDDLDQQINLGTKALKSINEQIKEKKPQLAEMDVQIQQKQSDKDKLTEECSSLKKEKEKSETELKAVKLEITKHLNIPDMPPAPFKSKPLPPYAISREQHIQDSVSRDLPRRERKQKEKEVGEAYDNAMNEYQRQLAQWEQWEHSVDEYNEKYGIAEKLLTAEELMSQKKAALDEKETTMNEDKAKIREAVALIESRTDDLNRKEQSIKAEVAKQVKAGVAAELRKYDDVIARKTATLRSLDKQMDKRVTKAQTSSGAFAEEYQQLNNRLLREMEQTRERALSQKGRSVAAIEPMKHKQRGR